MNVYVVTNEEFVSRVFVRREDAHAYADLHGVDAAIMVAERPLEERLDLATIPWHVALETGRPPVAYVCEDSEPEFQWHANTPYPFASWWGRVLAPSRDQAIRAAELVKERGDSSTDDTAMIQAAMAAADVVDATVVIPAGTYKTTAAITVGKNVTVTGEGAR